MRCWFLLFSWTMLFLSVATVELSSLQVVGCLRCNLRSGYVKWDDRSQTHEDNTECSGI